MDLMNDSREHIAATHSLVHAEQSSKSDEMLASHRTDSYQVLWSLSIDWTYSFMPVLSGHLCTQVEIHTNGDHAHCLRRNSIFCDTVGPESMTACLLAPWGVYTSLIRQIPTLVEKGQEDQLAYVQALDPEHFLSFL